jgi:hypothetical protein
MLLALCVVNDVSRSDERERLDRLTASEAIVDFVPVSNIGLA